MSYDERLACRVRDALASLAGGVTERKMFGGICFMVDGAMCCGVLGSELIVRVGPDAYADALARSHARAFDFTGRPSKGIVYVAPSGVRTASSLDRWIGRGLAFAKSASLARRKARWPSAAAAAAKGRSTGEPPPRATARRPVRTTS